MPQDVFFIDYSECDLDELKYMKIQKKRRLQINTERLRAVWS